MEEGIVEMQEIGGGKSKEKGGEEKEAGADSEKERVYYGIGSLEVEVV